MDGYAIRAADTAGATEDAPVELRVVGDIAAGAAPGRHGRRRARAVRIATGARLPPGADAVVPVEATTPLDAAGRPGSARPRRHGPVPAACLVHERGRAGRLGPCRRQRPRAPAQALLAPGHARSTPRPSTLIAGAGVGPTSLVHRRPRVAVLATGDEVRAPGEPLGPAGIPDANGPGPARARHRGRRRADRPRDRRRTTSTTSSARLRRGLDDGADALIVSGGVSVGPYDVVKTAIETIGRIDLWRVAVQPGKPFAFGVADRPGGGSAGPAVRPARQPGLLGGHVRAVRPARRSAALAGRHDLLRPVDRAVLGEPVSKSHGRRAFLRVEADRDATGAPIRDGRGPRRGPPRGRAGEPRHLGPGRRRRPGGHPRGGRFAAGRRRGRRSGGSTAHDGVTRLTRLPDPEDPMESQTAATRRTAPALPRRPGRPAADGRRLATSR